MVYFGLTAQAFSLLGMMDGDLRVVPSRAGRVGPIMEERCAAGVDVEGGGRRPLSYPAGGSLWNRYPMMSTLTFSSITA